MNRSLAGTLFLFVFALTGCASDSTAPSAAPTISAVAGMKQAGFAGDALPDPLTVRVTSVGGAALAGDTVHWQVVSGGGSLAAPFSVTDADGNASVVWTLGPASGDQEVKAFITYKTSNGLTSTLAHFSATATVRPTPRGAILHYDGNAWSVAYQTSDPAILLNAIWGTSPPSVFAVGSRCGGMVVLQFDGTAWTPPPEASCGLSDVSSVWGSEGSDFVRIVRGSTPMEIVSSVMRYDGAAWRFVYSRGCSALEPPCDPYLNAVWSGSSNVIVAVGDGGVVARYDGSAWTTDPSGTAQHLRAVWGPTGVASPIFAVGDAGTIIVFDGSAWHPQASGTSAALYAVWGTSANDVFAAGEGGTIIHYDGASWSLQSSTGGALHGLWGSSATSVFAVGDGPTILHYDGSKWTAQAASAPIDLRGVWGLSPTDVFAVGHAR